MIVLFFPQINKKYSLKMEQLTAIRKITDYQPMVFKKKDIVIK